MRGFRRRRRWRLAGRGPGLLVVAGLFWLLVRLAGRALDPLVGAVAEMETRAAALEVMNRVVVEEVVAGTTYTDLVRYETDGAGNVTVLQVNTPEVNRLAARAVTAVEAELQRLRERPFYVPLGELLGSPFLAHTGPRVPVHFLPIGAVTASVRQNFEAAGFNQTRHQVLLELEATVRVVVPLVSREVRVTSNLPLAETIIAGKVPSQLWLGGESGQAPVLPAPAVPGAPGW